MHIWCFGLDDPSIDILSIGELEVVELAVLRAGAVHPDWSLRFDENAATVINIDLVVVGEVKLVVGNPKPVVFEVDSRFSGDVQEKKGTFTVRVVVGRDIGVLGTSVALQASASRATDAHMDIPHARGTLRGLGDIPFHHDCTWGWPFGLEDEIAHFDRAGVAWLADLEDGSWRCLIGECGTGSHD